MSTNGYILPATSVDEHSIGENIVDKIYLADFNRNYNFLD